MKYIIQLAIILVISFLGEILNYFIPLPIPASIYGLIILFICLETRIIKISSVRETAKFLVDIMPIMFIPAGVGLMESWGILQPILLPVTIVITLSTVVVMVVSGRLTQFVIRRKNKEA